MLKQLKIMEIINLKKNLIKFLEQQSIIIQQVVIDTDDTFLIFVCSENCEKLGNSIGIKIESSQRFGVSISIFASEDYIFNNEEDILKKAQNKLVEIFKNSKFIRVFDDKNNILLSLIVACENKLSKNDVYKIFKSKFIIANDQTPYKIETSDFYGNNRIVVMCSEFKADDKSKV